MTITKDIRINHLYIHRCRYVKSHLI